MIWIGASLHNWWWQDNRVKKHYNWAHVVNSKTLLKIVRLYPLFLVGLVPLWPLISFLNPTSVLRLWSWLDLELLSSNIFTPDTSQWVLGRLALSIRLLIPGPECKSIIPAHLAMLTNWVALSTSICHRYVTMICKPVGKNLWGALQQDSMDHNWIPVFILISLEIFPPRSFCVIWVYKFDQVEEEIIHIEKSGKIQDLLLNC